MIPPFRIDPITLALDTLSPLATLLLPDLVTEVLSKHFQSNLEIVGPAAPLLGKAGMTVRHR